jgi:outer membrane protein TolC
MFPRLDAVGNVTYANPNQRFFPQSQTWHATWDISIQLTWSPNDAIVAHDNKKAISSQTGVLKATREQIADGLALDVTNAYAKVREAEGSIATTKVELRAAEEAYRVRKEQFTLGATTSALLIDAEADVTRARLNHLNARVDLRIARVQLKKAIGELQ